MLIKMSLKFIPKAQIDNNPAFDYMITWRQPGDKQLFEPMMVSLLMDMYVTRPQCVKLSIVFDLDIWYLLSSIRNLRSFTLILFYELSAGFVGHVR